LVIGGYQLDLKNNLTLKNTKQKNSTYSLQHHNYLVKHFYNEK